MFCRVSNQSTLLTRKVDCDLQIELSHVSGTDTINTCSTYKPRFALYFLMEDVNRELKYLSNTYGMNRRNVQYTSTSIISQSLLSKLSSTLVKLVLLLDGVKIVFFTKRAPFWVAIYASYSHL